MRTAMRTVIAVIAMVAPAAPCLGDAGVIGAATPLGASAFEQRMNTNPEIETFVRFHGYPDWAEDVEVDTGLPLDSHETRIYYLRLDRELSFTYAYMLGRPAVSMRLFDRPIPAADRARIEEAYLAKDPARRAEMAADRAVAAAERAERAADSMEAAADKAEQFSDEMEHDFHRRLRK